MWEAQRWMIILIILIILQSSYLLFKPTHVSMWTGAVAPMRFGEVSDGPSGRLLRYVLGCFWEASDGLIKTPSRSGRPGLVTGQNGALSMEISMVGTRC